MISLKTYFCIEDAIVPLDKLSKNILDPEYIEGSLELKINNVTFVDKETWDDISDLWSYLINGLEELIVKNADQVFVSFPGESIELNFERVASSETIQVKVNWPGLKQATVSLIEFYKTIFAESERYYEKMLLLIQNAEYIGYNQMELERVRYLKEKVLVK
ncbi:hypothetical protein AB3N59_04995 [Leptospira sp. WS92.C1]